MTNPPNPAVAQFIQALGEAARKRQAERAGQPPIPTTPTEPWSEPTDKLITLKPDDQQIKETNIQWGWTVEEIGNLYAFYFTKDDPDFHSATGDFVVTLALDSTDNTFEMTSTGARALAVALLSAAQWEGMWQQHMGEFFAATPEPQPQPEPEAEVVVPIKKASPRKRVTKKEGTE